ncbi:hypothetical protein [Pseudoalteromonas sp. Ld20]|uniref:hypothetical protein n=1 Tax=Pseudoalteromonas sp. Ld20 TaxID=649165 RepID=UPI00386D3FDA
MQKKYPSLECIVDFKCANVLDGFQKSFKIERIEAEKIFNEMLKWMWFCSSPKTTGARVIDAPILIIDEMWHTFILYTKEYFYFCDKFFGHYMHHSPTTSEDLDKYKKLSETDLLESKRTQYELVYDLLGKDTFITWYHEFPEKYSAEKILKIRRR